MLTGVLDYINSCVDDHRHVDEFGMFSVLNTSVRADASQVLWFVGSALARDLVTILVTVLDFPVSR